MDTIFSSIKLKNKYIFFLFVIFSFLFFKQYPRYDYVDYGIYNAYARSIVHDGNLNISNELYSIRTQRGEPIIQTPTHYDPDFHSHGSAILFSPFILISKSLSSLGFFKKSSFEKYLNLPWMITSKNYVEDSFIGAFTFALAIWTLVLGMLYLLKSFQVSNVFFSALIIFLGTPLYNYLIKYPGNMNIVIMFFFTITYIFLYEKKMKLNGFDFFMLMSFLSVGFLIKTDIVFMLVLVPIILKESNLSRAEFIRALIIPLCLMALFFVNRYIQYG